MACGFDHRVVAGTVIGVTIAVRESQTGESTAWPLLGGGLGAAFGTLPDIIEPAHAPKPNPNHRQFFHGLAFAAALGYGGYKLYQWRPEEPWQKAARMVGLIAISAYLIHLAMDATTPKSLPIVGKLG